MPPSALVDFFSSSSDSGRNRIRQLTQPLSITQGPYCPVQRFDSWITTVPKSPQSSQISTAGFGSRSLVGKETIEFRRRLLGSNGKSCRLIGRPVDGDFLALVPLITSDPSYTNWSAGWKYRSGGQITYFGPFENVLH